MQTPMPARLSCFFNTSLQAATNLDPNPNKNSVDVQTSDNAMLAYGGPPERPPMSRVPLRRAVFQFMSYVPGTPF